MDVGRSLDRQSVVGLLESLMTAQIVDELTDTKSDRNQECIGQGIANTATDEGRVDDRRSPSSSAGCFR